MNAKQPSRSEDARPTGARKRLLIFVVAYNAERTIESVLARIPESLTDQCDVEILVIDDASADRTFERGERVRRDDRLAFPLHVLFNPVNQGYGGNQKIGFHFALNENFDFVALLHGDGQYAPESLPDLLAPLLSGDADAVFGSRMLSRGGAREGGMPLYKFVGNKVLTSLQNKLLRTRLSEFHSGYRLYSIDALRRIPFDLNTDDFHFDTEIIIQLVLAKQRIRELPIPTYYGDEICHVNGMKYAFDVVRTTFKARSQELDLFYDRRFDCSVDRTHARYTPKFDHDSTHTLALARIPAGSRVLDLGCAGGYLGAELRAKGCYVAGIDLFPMADGLRLDEFYLWDLNTSELPVDPAAFDVVVMLDVIEHLASPESFLDYLHNALADAPEAKLIISTGNIAFAPLRAMLVMGQFNYGRRGILDLTHTRLFTFATLRRLLEGASFRIVEERGVVAPFTKAVGETRLARTLLGVNQGLVRLRRELFSYQAFVVAQPRLSLPHLLTEARQHSRDRADSLASWAPEPVGQVALALTPRSPDGGEARQKWPISSDPSGGDRKDVFGGPAPSPS